MSAVGGRMPLADARAEQKPSAICAQAIYCRSRLKEPTSEHDGRQWTYGQTCVFLDLFGIPVRYPVNHVINLFPCGNSPHLSSLLSKNSILRFQKHTQLKCSMLAMFIPDKMWPRSHPCQVAPTHIPRSVSVNVKPGTWHLLSIKLEAPPSPFFTFPETSCVRNFPGSQFN